MDQKGKNFKIKRRYKVKKFTFGSQKSEYDWQRRKAKGGSPNAVAREPWRTSQRLVECRRRCTVKGKKFEGGEVWKFLEVSNGGGEKILFGSEIQSGKGTWKGKKGLNQPFI